MAANGLLKSTQESHGCIQIVYYVQTYLLPPATSRSSWGQPHTLAPAMRVIMSRFRVRVSKTLIGSESGEDMGAPDATVATNEKNASELTQRCQMSFRLSKDEADTLKAAAAAFHMPTGTYVARQCVYLDKIHAKSCLSDIPVPPEYFKRCRPRSRGKVAHFYVSAAERQEIISQAARNGLSVPDYIAYRCIYLNMRMPMMGYIEEDHELAASDLPTDAAISQTLDKAWVELKHQGVNLNQIAHAANTIALDTRSSKSIKLARELRQLVKELSPGLKAALSGIADASASMRSARR